MKLDKIIGELSDSEILDIYNAANEDDYICYNGRDFLESFYSDRLVDLVYAVKYGDYDPEDNFVKFDDNGYLISTNYISDFVSGDTLLDILEEYKDNELIKRILEEHDFEEE